MITTKWFMITISVPAAELLKAMTTERYHRNIACGLDIGEITPTKVLGKFIEQIIQTTSFVDPFGEQIENTFTYYKIFSFELTHVKDDGWLLRVDNPPRSLKSFVNFLSKICKGKFSIESLQLPVIDFLSNLRVREVLHELRIARLMISGLSFGSGTSAKLDVRSTEDALQEVKNYYKNNFYVVDKVFGSLTYDENFAEIEVSRTAVISASDEVLLALNPVCVNYFSSRFS